MPDITMCSDHNCPQKEDCYRYNAKPSEYSQSYFVGSPRENNKCDYFWEMKKKPNNETEQKSTNFNRSS